jgi:hypothetical protein
MTIEELKKLMKDLGASEETTSDGFTFIELDSKKFKKKEGTSSKQQEGTSSKQHEGTSSK